MVGGGAAVFDCSGDGLPEVFAAGGTAPAALFRNASAPGGPIVLTRAESGLEIDSVAGAYPLDIDGDGVTDLAVLRVGPDKLMRGLGDCRFEDASEAWGFDGLDLWSTAFAATWERGNDWPTLAVGTYIDRTQEAFPWGNCTRTSSTGPRARGTARPSPSCRASARCRSSSPTGTGRDARAPRVERPRVLQGRAGADVAHPARGAARACSARPTAGSACASGGWGSPHDDLDFDGYPEFFLTSMADNKLQKLAEVPAEGGPRPVYRDVAWPMGVTAHRPYTGGDVRPSTAWHAQFGDVNNDGLSDLFVVKGNVWDMPDFAEADPNNLLLQREDGTFMEAGDRAGVASMRQGARGGARRPERGRLARHGRGEPERTRAGLAERGRRRATGCRSRLPCRRGTATRSARGSSFAARTGASGTGR